LHRLLLAEAERASRSVSAMHVLSSLRGMVKNHGLARALSDAAIGGCIRKLEEKAAMHGKTVIRIDRFFPSTKTCSGCGCIQRKMLLSVRDWIRPECGASHDRDENAAINIKAAGLAVSAQGGGRRLRRDTSRKSIRLRTANQQGVRQHA
jgi:putative transposase